MNYFIIMCVLLVSGEQLSLQDIINLSDSKIETQVIVSQIDVTGSVFHLSADDIIHLHKEGVSQPVIMHMIQTGKKEQKPAMTNGQETARSNNEVNLTISNQAEKPYSIMIDEQAKRIFYYYGHMNDRLVLQRDESTSLTLAEGIYQVKWVGEQKSFALHITKTSIAKMVTSHVTFTQYSALNLSLFENDKQQSDGPLKIFQTQTSSSISDSPSSTKQPPVKVIYHVSEPTVIYEDRVYDYPLVRRRSSYRNHYYSSRHSDSSQRLLTPNKVLWGGTGALMYRKNRLAGGVLGYALGSMLDSRRHNSRRYHHHR